MRKYTFTFGAFFLLSVFWGVSCMEPEFVNFGRIKNQSARYIVVVWSDVPHIESISDFKRYRAIYIHKMQSGNLVGPIYNTNLDKPINYKWYFHIYDQDTILKYLQIAGEYEAAQKAFLKTDTITQGEILGKKVLISYSDNKK